MSILKVENLSKIYGEKDTKTIAVDNVSFEVEKGEFVAIVGTSGSGKSTLLHMIGGVDKPTSGTIEINGVNIYELDEAKQAEFRRREVALIYQFYNLIPVLNVEENMCLPIKLDNKKVEENITLPILLDNKKVDEQKLSEMIETLGLKERRKNLPNELSGGQQQRVAIGRSLMQNPCVLLADEPTGNLDSQNSKEIIELLKKSNKEYDQTIILVTHDEEIAKQADRIITINDGKIV